MARLLKSSTPMGQMGERVVRTGLDMGPESGFFGREFTASDLKDTFNLVDQGIGIIKEAEPIADYFSRASKERDKQAALKEIAEKRAGINAQKAAQVKLEQQKQRDAVDMQQLDRMVLPEVPSISGAMQEIESRKAALSAREAAMEGLTKDMPLSKTPLVEETIWPWDKERLLGSESIPEAGLYQTRFAKEPHGDRVYDPAKAALRDIEAAVPSQPPLNVQMPGPIASPATAAAPTTPKATVTPQQQRLVQAAQQRVGAGPRGAQRLSDGTYRDPLDPNLVAAYESLEESTGLPLRQIYAGSMPRYTPGTPDPVLPSEEALELKGVRELNTYRNLVRTPQEAALFNRLMDTAIKREGSDFMEEFETRDALEKELFKSFDFAKGKKPRKLDSGALKLDEIRKARKDFFKQSKRKGLNVKGRVKIPKDAADLIANGVITVERGTYKDGDNVVTSENGVTSKAYAGYLEALSGQSQSRSTVNAQKIANAERSEESRRAVMDSLGIDGLDAADKPASMKAIKRRLAAWATVTDKQVNDAKKGVKASVGAKPGTIIRGTQGNKRIVQRDTGLEQSQQRIDLKVKDFNLKKATGESDDAFRERKLKVWIDQKAADLNITSKKLEENVRQFNKTHGLRSDRFRHDAEDDLKLYNLRVRAANRADGNDIINLASALAKQADEGEKLKVFTKTMEKELKRKAPLKVNQSVNPEPKPKEQPILTDIADD